MQHANRTRTARASTLVLIGALVSLPTGATAVPAEQGGGGQPSKPPQGEGAPSKGGKGQKEELQGKERFSREDFQSHLLGSEKARKIQARMSKLRQKKIDRLLGMIESDRPNKKEADLLFRLAEAYWQEAKYQYLKGRAEYDRKMKCYDAGRCSEEPEEPTRDYSKALQYYRRIIDEHPDYRRIDEVIYYLGRGALKAGKDRDDVQLQKEGVKRLQDLVQNYPDSKFVPDAHLALAEHYFKGDSLYYAKTNYEKIVDNYPDAPMYNYALYKLGWVYFNLLRYDKTVATFKKVIAQIGQTKNQAKVRFKKQALNDLIVAWSEIEDGWKDAREYFMEQVGEEETYKKLDKLAGLLISKDRNIEAVELHNHLIEHDPSSPKVVGYFGALLEVHRRVGDREAIDQTVERMVEFFDHEGTWWLANDDEETRQKADDLLARNLITVANHYHKKAQEAAKENNPSQDIYAKAANYYKTFLDNFPDHEKSYAINFNYAEILYHQTEDYAKAAEQYEAVLEKKPKGEFVEDAALGVVYAVEKMMVEEGLREKVSKGVSYEDENDTEAEDIENEELEPIPETDLKSLEKRFVDAADAYVEAIRNALDDPDFEEEHPNAGDMIPRMMFIAAQTFYKHGQMQEAVERLQVIFDLYPQHKMAHIAVNTIIDAFARLKRWQKVEKWARELIDQGNFKVKSREELEDMIVTAKAERARNLTKQRNYEKAISVQREIVNEFGSDRPTIAAKALHNIGIIHETARRFPKAVKAYRRVIDRYPDEDVAVQAQFDIGVLYESQTKFEKAAQAFIKMEEFQDNPKAEDAIQNAALIYEALGKFRKAHETFRKYVELFEDNDKASNIAYRSAQVLEELDSAEAYVDAAKTYLDNASRFASPNGDEREYWLRNVAAAGIAYKRADAKTEDHDRRARVEDLLGQALEKWEELNPKLASKDGGGGGSKSEATDAQTKRWAAKAAFEMAEYAYYDYTQLEIEAINSRDEFDIQLLKDSLADKAEGLADAQKAYDEVLAFQDSHMAAAAAFREGLLLYEFSQSLFNAPVPPQIKDKPRLVNEYRYQLEQKAGPMEEKALIAFTAALKQAIKQGVYNEWSRKSAEYAAKVNPDEFPISDFELEADKTKDTVKSTSFIRVIRKGDTVVDFTTK